MSILSIEQTTKTPALDAVLGSIERKPSTEASLSEVEARIASDKGRDMIEHFTAFVEGKEEGFSRYFVTSNPIHDAMHGGFWSELSEQYPGMVVLAFPDEPRIRQYVFYEQKAALIERTDFAHTGEVSGVNYEAHYLADVPVDVVGKLATALAMQ